MVYKSSINQSGSGGGVTSINGVTGAANITSTGGSIVVTTVGNNVNLEAVTGGSGTVTSVSGTNANGVSFSIANATTTPNITISLGAITPSTVNGLTFTSQAIGFTIAGGTLSKTLTVSNTANVSGTNTGDQTSVSGNAGTATALQTPRAIAITGSTGLTASGVNFDGTAAINLALTGTLTIASGGTGQTTANTAFNALVPSQSTNSGKFLTTDGTNTGWATVSGGGTTVNINTLQIDQNPNSGTTYGAISGAVDGVNKVFTVSNNAYASGSLMVFLLGQSETQGSGADWTETSPASGTFTFVTAPPSGSILQAAYIKSSSASGIPTAPMVSITGVNAKTTGGTLAYASPSGKSTVITNAIVRCTAASAITVGPSCSVGTSSGATDIFASTALTALTTTSKIYGFTLFGMSVIVPPSGTVYFNVDVAATGTSQVLAVDFEGYQI